MERNPSSWFIKFTSTNQSEDDLIYMFDKWDIIKLS